MGLKNWIGVDSMKFCIIGLKLIIYKFEATHNQLTVCSRPHHPTTSAFGDAAYPIVSPLVAKRRPFVASTPWAPPRSCPDLKVKWQVPEFSGQAVDGGYRSVI